MPTLGQTVTELEDVKNLGAVDKKLLCNETFDNLNAEDQKEVTGKLVGNLSAQDRKEIADKLGLPPRTRGRRQDMEHNSTFVRHSSRRSVPRSRPHLYRCGGMAL
jgi:hypothetical protein